MFEPTSPELSFADLLRSVRAGDAEAASRLVRQYEPEIRRAVRLRLTDARLRRTLDSVDVCQSVLTNFFVRAAAGQFELERPEQLLQLLVRMAHNKVIDKAREGKAARRDVRRVEAGNSEVLNAAAGRGETPSEIVAGRELLTRTRELLSDEEQRLFDARALGREWAEIAAEVGGTPEALRKKLTRALDRVVEQLG
jgi:RNA polymerase sigma factor (sigma-70 family)